MARPQFLVYTRRFAPTYRSNRTEWFLIATKPATVTVLHHGRSIRKFGEAQRVRTLVVVLSVFDVPRLSARQNQA
jgi:hypothetical protein